MSSASNYPSLRPTPPLSGRSSPLPLQPANKPSSAAALNNKRVAPPNDIFANLVAFSAPQSEKSLSLQEQQKALQEKKRSEQERAQENAYGVNVGNQDGEFWDSLGDGRARQNGAAAPPSYAGTDEYGGPKLSKAINKPFAGIADASRNSQKENPANSSVDLLLDIDGAPGDTPIDSDELLLHTGQPIKNSNRVESPSLLNGSLALDQAQKDSHTESFDFGGLGGSRAGGDPTVSSSADDDILGLLGRPISEFKAAKKEHSAPEYTEIGSADPADHALAELVDMGFSPEKSKEALRSTRSGKDTQEAVGWLLNQAHVESRSKTKSDKRGHDPASQLRRSPSDSGTLRGDAPSPAWMREQNLTHQEKHLDDSRTPVYGERDPGKYASELGNTLFKTANTLWKTGAHNITKAVSELNSDSDSSQPKWMREGQGGAGMRKSRPAEREKSMDHETERQDTNHESKTPVISRRQPSNKEESSVTDEALLLESGDGRPPPRKPFRPDKTVLPMGSLEFSRNHSPAVPERKLQSRETPRPQILPQPPYNDIKARLNRQTTEEQSSNVYMSPARRKRPTKPSSTEQDLLFDTSQPTSRPSHSISHTKMSTPSTTPTPIQASITSRLKPQARHIPFISPSALRISTTNRREGSSAFKRGDYALATTHYSTALSALPPTHPHAIILFTNRALAHLKTGDPKSSIADAKSALDLIGPLQGALEQIDLGEEGSKEMKIFWAKAMARQAEALEQLERWSDAASAWRSCIEAGAGDAVSIAGRNRCEKAAAGPSQATQVPKPSVTKRPPGPKTVRKTSALDALAGNSTQDSSSENLSTEAVKRLRKANLEAERVDDEKFALSDQVSERLARWRTGKESNLRALLASLDTVLWEGAGWKKVGMGELIVPGKVKVAYMKGIAKVHPDKVRVFWFDLSCLLDLVYIICPSYIRRHVILLILGIAAQLPQTATTEQRMISAAVFAALNEAWDGFKRSNGLW